MPIQRVCIQTVIHRHFLWSKAVLQHPICWNDPCMCSIEAYPHSNTSWDMARLHGHEAPLSLLIVSLLEKELFISLSLAEMFWPHNTVLFQRNDPDVVNQWGQERYLVLWNNKYSNSKRYARWKKCSFSYWRIRTDDPVQEENDRCVMKVQSPKVKSHFNLSHRFVNNFFSQIVLRILNLEIQQQCTKINSFQLLNGAKLQPKIQASFWDTKEITALPVIQDLAKSLWNTKPTYPLLSFWKLLLIPGFSSNHPTPGHWHKKIYVVRPAAAFYYYYNELATSTYAES